MFSQVLSQPLILSQRFTTDKNLYYSIGASPRKNSQIGQPHISSPVDRGTSLETHPKPVDSKAERYGLWTRPCRNHSPKSGQNREKRSIQSPHRNHTLSKNKRRKHRSGVQATLRQIFLGQLTSSSSSAKCGTTNSSLGLLSSQGQRNQGSCGNHSG